MLINEMRKLIEESDYWDSRVKAIECNYFADEIQVVYDDDDGNSVWFAFNGCYKAVFDHVKEYDKNIPVKNMTLSQIPYFIQEIELDETIEFDNKLWICKINMFPLYLEIWCKDIKIEKSSK